jgi:hypothetical protein
MYYTKYMCRYKNDNVFLETDNVSDAEKEYIRNILYKEDLLNIFDISYNDEIDKFNDAISNLYEKIKNNNFFKECMTKIASSFINTDEEFGLCILYSFDFMYLTHKCVSEYLDNGKISDENINLLKNSVDKYVNN